MVSWFGNRRQYARVIPLARKPVELQLMGSDFLEVLHAADLSVGGVGIQVDHTFSGYDLSAEVKILIKLPGKRPFLAEGLVRHKTSRDGLESYGIEFTRLSAEAKADIHEYVEGMLELSRRT